MFNPGSKPGGEKTGLHDVWMPLMRHIPDRAYYGESRKIPLLRKGTKEPTSVVPKASRKTSCILLVVAVGTHAMP
jgi:hypothetical protein